MHLLQPYIPTLVVFGLMAFAILFIKWLATPRSIISWQAADPAQYERKRVYPLRRGRQTGPAESPGDGWVEFRGDNDATVLFHVSFEFEDHSEYKRRPMFREPRARLISPDEILAARFRLADGAEGSFADLFREAIAHWPKRYANALNSKEITDGAEMGAEMALESKMYDLMRQRNDAFATRDFTYTVHATFRHRTDHERELGLVETPQLTELVA